MFTKSIKSRFSFLITALIAVLILVLAFALLLDFRSSYERLRDIGISYLQEARVEQVYRRINLAAATLGEHIIEPLQNEDNATIDVLLSNTVKQHDFLFAEVFDTDGAITHGAHSRFAIERKAVEEPRYVSHVRRGKSPLLIPDDYQIIVIHPLWLGDTPIGGLRVGLDVRRIDTDTLTMTGAFSNELEQSLAETRNTTIIAVLIAISFGLMFAIGLATRFVRPIRQLAARSEEIGKGNQVTQLLSSREDELGQLITAFNHMSERLKQTTVSRDFVYHIIGGMHDALTVINTKGYINLANKASTKVLAIPQHSIEGERFTNFIVENDRERISHWLDSVADNTNSATESYLVTADEQLVPVALTASILTWDETGPLIVCVAQDISDRRRDEERIRYLAQYDPLTGLANRALFMDRLNHAMHQAEMGEHVIALLFIDIDRFKRVNDSLGQGVGDELLRQIGDRLKQCVRQGDTVARLAGDEFTIILELIQRTEWVDPVVEKILARLREPFDLGVEPVYISASIGIAYAPFDESSSEDLVKKADLAMYRAKDQGRSTHCYYSADISSYPREALSLEGELRQAVTDEAFHLVYQPQISLMSQKVVGVEALLRWDHPTLGDIPRDNFIPLLEENGLIAEVGQWVIREASTAAKEWAKTQELRVSVNFSTRQFVDDTLPDQIAAALDEIGLPPRLFELEITETSLITDVEQSQRIIERMADMGVSIAVDDFGTGYSSFEYLQNFKVHALKVDRSFVKGLPDDQSAKAICAAIIGLGKIMNLRVIVEGIETQAQLEMIEDMGAVESQGYYTGKPMLAIDIQRLIERPVVL